jgi:D-amino peptidase
MKVYISCDLEGINGVIAGSQCGPGGNGYELARLWMTEEANAAIRGAAQAGAQEIVVKDSHGSATNILLDKLDGRAQLISGWGMNHSMVEGLDETFDALLLVGYHAMARTPTGALSHTMTGYVHGVAINGQPVGESGIAALYAGAYGVPLVFASGDAALTAEIQALIPGVQTVTVKNSLSRQGSMMKSVEQTRREIESEVFRALSAEKFPEPYHPQPIEMEYTTQTPEAAQLCSYIPTVERVDALRVRFPATDGVAASKLFYVIRTICGTFQ